MTAYCSGAAATDAMRLALVASLLKVAFRV